MANRIPLIVDSTAKQIQEVQSGDVITLTNNISNKQRVNNLMERGISTDTINEFKIGYSLKEGHTLTKALLKEGFSRETIEKTGLCLTSEKNALFDRFRDRIMFPILNKYSKIVAFGGRAINEGFGA